MNQVLDDIDRAIKDVAAGRPVVVVDDANRENEGDIILAAAMATPELLAFMIRYTSGVICVPLPGAELDRLQLPLMTSQNTERMRTAFTLSVDARDGVSTGISAADRWDRVRISLPASISRYVVHKGSIAVDGISLTVSAVGPPGGDTWFEVSLIPETLKRTTMGAAQPGETVNLEVDVIGKYVERLLNREAHQ